MHLDYIYYIKLKSPTCFGRYKVYCGPSRSQNPKTVLPHTVDQQHSRTGPHSHQFQRYDSLTFIRPTVDFDCISL